MTAVSDGGDLLACGHCLSYGGGVFVVVTVGGDGSVVVLDAYPQSESLCRAGADDHPVGDGDDGCSCRVGDVDALVIAAVTEG